MDYSSVPYVDCFKIESGLFVHRIFHSQFDPDKSNYKLLVDKADYDKLKTENEKLKLQLEFTAQYLNPADTSFRTMIDNFNGLSDVQKEKITNLAKSLADL